MLAAALALAAFTELMAQGRATVRVEEFTADAAYTADQVASVRAKVVNALLRTERVNVCDALSGATGAMATGGEYAMHGYLEQPSAQTEELKDDNGRRMQLHTVAFNYVVWLADIQSGRASTAFRFSSSGTGESDDEALASACRTLRVSLARFVEQAFPLRAAIVAVDQESNGKAKTVYIDMGSASGVKAKQKFDVTITRDVAGVETPTVVGTLTAREVTEQRTLCDVSDGGEAIASGMQRGVVLNIRSRAKQGLLKGFGRLMEQVQGSTTILSTTTGIPLNAEEMQKLNGVASAQPTVADAAAAPATSVAPSSGYYDFAKLANGRRMPEPLLKWDSTIADIRAYMQGKGMTEQGNLMYMSDNGMTIAYMVINDKFTAATAMIHGTDRTRVVDWLKAHYTYKSCENNMYGFKRADGTKITATFVSVNGSKPSVTIMYMTSFDD